MSRHMLGSAVLILMAIVVDAATADPVVLARGGRSAATIVIPANSPERVSLAATELQHYVSRICGVELPIQRDGKRVEGVGLYIGRCEPSRDGDAPDKSLNPETYAIRVRDGNVFFAGRYATPIYFAVVSFIEDSLGVRWFAPGDAWEYVPKGTPGELTAEPRDGVKVPSTSPRLWSGHNFADSWIRWNLRNKVVQGEVVPRRQFQNNLYRVFPPSRYGKTHPEYYPLIDGKRWIPEPGYRYWRPCESNPDVIRLTVEYARKWFDEHPETDSFSVGMDDISHLCGCPTCRALDPHPDSYEKHEFSDRHYKFVNAVAREIAKTHPDRYVGALIYAIARKPPKTVDRLEDNVFGFITEVSARWCEPGRKDADHAITREWARRCKHLSRYDYFGLGTFTPRYYPHSMAEQIKFDKSLGLEGMYSELNTFLPHTAPMIWAFARLEWDASLDIDALLNEFMTKMFGPAAPAMARYFDLLERSWNTPPPGRTDWEHRNIFMQAQAISPAAVDEGMAILADAFRQADDEAVRQRIDTVRAGLQYAGYAIREYALSEELIKAPVTDAAEAERSTAKVLRIMQLSAERERFWTAAKERDDLLGENIRGLAGKGYLMIGRVGNLERGCGVGALRVLDWYTEHFPARLPEVTAKLTGSYRGGTSDLLRAWLWVRERKPSSLLMNPGFDRDVSKAMSQGSDRSPTASLAGWTTYGDAGRAQLLPAKGAGRNGSNAARISGARSGAIFLQSHDAQPGQRYLCRAYALSVPGGQDANGYLAVRFRKPDGTWHPRTDLEPQVYMVPQDSWQPLVVLFTVPDGAGRVVVMVGAKSQPANSAVLFDDIGLFRLPDQW
jgi:hypothetical protein